MDDPRPEPPASAASTSETSCIADLILRHPTHDDPVKSAPFESEQRWRLHYGFRSILLGLMCASSSVTAMLLLVPGLYSASCSAIDMDVPIIMTVLVLVPLLMFYANRFVHRRGLSHSMSKLTFVPLILGYYMPIVYHDSQTRATTGEPFFDSKCVLVIETSPNHLSDTMMLVDVAINFFICTCLLESWRTRSLHVVCHVALWASDNSTYPTYTTLGTRTQRVWHWVGFLVVEAQMMATIVAIAHAIDRMWESQWAQARLEARVSQVENEKERLVWDSLLRDHRARLMAIHHHAHVHGAVGLPSADSDGSDSTVMSPANTHRSHHTAKLEGPSGPLFEEHSSGPKAQQQQHETTTLAAGGGGSGAGEVASASEQQ